MSAANKPLARELVPAFLRDRPCGSRPSQLWVRVNRLDSGMILDDLLAAIGASRVALSLHYISDVVAGVVFGFAWLGASLWAFSPLFL